MRRLNLLRSLVAGNARVRHARGDAARVILAVVVAAVAVSPLSPSGAGGLTYGLSEPETIVLRHPVRPKFWTGGPVEGVALPEACAVLVCHEVTLEVDLPATRLSRRGGVQVAIRWRDERNNLDLYVYRANGEPVARSAAPFSTAEAVLLPLANRRYRVVVVPDGSDEVSYEGHAQVERPPGRAPRRDLLPDLISLPARRPQIATGAYVVNPGTPSLPTGCYPEETAEEAAMRCLRFDQIIANVGRGPFEIRYRIDDVAGAQTLEQRIYRSDGTWRDRRADTYEFHPAHAHFHYKNFAQAHLWRSNSRGDRLGSAPVASGRKNGFCMLDIELYWWGYRGDTARTYTPPGGCFGADEVDPTAGRVAATNGISVGWADIYFWYVADQFIEISQVPDGYYLLESVSDPEDTVSEVSDVNNSAVAHIRICGEAVQIVGEKGACRR